MWHFTVDHVWLTWISIRCHQFFNGVFFEKNLNFDEQKNWAKPPKQSSVLSVALLLVIVSRYYVCRGKGAHSLDKGDSRGPQNNVNIVEPARPKSAIPALGAKVNSRQTSPLPSTDRPCCSYRSTYTRATCIVFFAKRRRLLWRKNPSTRQSHVRSATQWALRTHCWPKCGISTINRTSNQSYDVVAVYSRIFQLFV